MARALVGLAIVLAREAELDELRFHRVGAGWVADLGQRAANLSMSVWGEQLYSRRMIDRDGIQQRWLAVGDTLDERGQRLFAGRGGQSGWPRWPQGGERDGLARSTINRGEDGLDGIPRAPSHICHTPSDRDSVIVRSV
jgi:hypothetical protein